MRLVIAVAVLCFLTLASLALGAEPLTASYEGFVDDRVGTLSLAQDGKMDLHFKVTGLRPEPIVKTRLESDGGGIWETPKNLTNWVVLLERNGLATSADIFAAGFGSQVSYSLIFTYASGAVDKITGIKSGFTSATPAESYPVVAVGATLSAVKIVVGQVIAIKSILNTDGSLDTKIVVEAR